MRMLSKHVYNPFASILSSFVSNLHTAEQKHYLWLLFNISIRRSGRSLCLLAYTFIAAPNTYNKPQNEKSNMFGEHIYQKNRNKLAT